jgi:hypothetical protein
MTKKVIGLFSCAKHFKNGKRTKDALFASSEAVFEGVILIRFSFRFFWRDRERESESDKDEFFCQ